MVKRNDYDYFNKKMVQLQDHIEDYSKLTKGVRPRFETLRIIVIYILLGGAWILLSDRFLAFFANDTDVFVELQLYKGWLYVAITGIFFYFIISKRMMLFKEAIDQVFEGFEELSAAHEELMAMDEELTHQFIELETSRNALSISNQRYELVIEGANDGIWDWDLITDTYFFSLKWKSTFGYKDQELANTFETWKSLLHPKDRERSVKKINTYLSSKKGIYQNTYRLRCRDGTYRWILSRGKGVWDSKGQPIRIAGSHTDITEQINLQEYLRQEKELLDNITYDAPIVIIILDNQGNIIKLNPFAKKITGYKEEELLGRSAFELLINKDDIETNRVFFKRILKGEQLRNYEFDIKSKDGRKLSILWNNNLLHDHKGKNAGAVFIGLDINERKEMEEKLYTLAYYDQLTNLPNRTHLEEVVDRLIDEAKEKKQKLAFIYLDMDNFKNINDTMGHGSGDQLLVYIANILSELVQPPNFLARLGGDEFAIIITNINSTDEIIKNINDILHHLRRPWKIKDHEFHISVSMGIAFYPEHGRELSVLMQNADAAMFHIKENGKDFFAIYTPAMQEEAWKYLEMSSSLKSAIINEDFSLHYQPQINIKTGKIIGVEALIRWEHPEKGFIPPVQFITFAEKTGDITQIEKWVFKTICIQKRKWEKQGYVDFKISVNLSGKMLNHSELISNMEKMLIQYDIKYCDIVLEITETAIMDDLEKAIQVLNKLKGLGITIALDDFGKGYSSLTYLQKLPIDILKVDRKFIKNVPKENKESFIFKAIVQLAHNLGLKVVAEGVETKEQLLFIKENDCNIAQGYYFSKPLSVDELELHLMNNSADIVKFEDI